MLTVRLFIQFLVQILLSFGKKSSNTQNRYFEIFTLIPNVPKLLTNKINVAINILFRAILTWIFSSSFKYFHVFFLNSKTSICCNRKEEFTEYEMIIDNNRDNRDSQVIE